MFRKIFRFKKIILGFISILIMILSYPLLENIVFLTSKTVFPWEYYGSKSYKEILISDFEDGDQLKDDMIDLASKNNINIFFKDYEIDDLNTNKIYYYINDQGYLDKLPFTKEIRTNEFNNSTKVFSNNDNNKSIGIISSKKYEYSVRSFKNYGSKRFLGQLLVFGKDEALDTFEHDLNKIEGNNLDFVDFDPNRIEINYSNFQIIVSIVQEILKDYQFQVFVILLLIVIAIDIDSQKRKIGIYKLNGYTKFNIFAYFLKENILIFILSSIIAVLPVIILNQEVLNLNSFKFLPYYLLIVSIISILIVLISFIFSYFSSSISMSDIVYRRKKNESINIGFLVLKVTAICILGINILYTLDVKKDYDLYKDAIKTYENIHKDYYILSSTNFAANRQVYDAHDSAINEIIDKEGVLYYEIDYEANSNIVSANINYINSLNLKSIDNRKIELDESNKEKTYIVTKNSYEKLEDSIKNSKMIYESRGLKTDDPNIIVIDNIRAYPQFNEYIHGTKPTDKFVMVVENSKSLNSANVLYKAKNINSLEKEFFPIFDQYISSKLLKFEKEKNFYGKFEKDARDKYIELTKKLIVILLIYILINVYIFNLSFSNISKKLGVNMLMGNPIIKPSIKILIYNVVCGMISFSTISYLLKLDFTLYLKIIIGLVLFDLLSYGLNLLKYKKSLISILKSSMEE